MIFYFEVLSVISPVGVLEQAREIRLDVPGLAPPEAVTRTGAEIGAVAIRRLGGHGAGRAYQPVVFIVVIVTLALRRRALTPDVGIMRAPPLEPIGSLVDLGVGLFWRNLRRLCRVASVLFKSFRYKAPNLVELAFESLESLSNIVVQPIERALQLLEPRAQSAEHLHRSYIVGTGGRPFSFVTVSSQSHRSVLFVAVSGVSPIVQEFSSDHILMEPHLAIFQSLFGIFHMAHQLDLLPSDLMLCSLVVRTDPRQPRGISTYPPTLRRPLGLWVWGALLGTLVPTVASAQADPETEESATHHQRGLELYEREEYDAAIEEFNRAETISHNRANLWNLARCYERTGRNATAMDYLDLYLREPDLPSERRERALALRRALAERGGDSLRGPWAILGVGLALAVTGGVLDVLAYTRSRRGGDEPFVNMDEYDRWRDGVEGLAIAGDILVLGGVGVAVAGLIWLLMARRSPEPDGTPTLTAGATAGGGLLLLNGSFP